MDAMIELAGLTKVFGRTRAVDDLTCSIEPGMVTGFLGPNGAGKTTTMRMILGLDHPTSGTATIDGKTYRELTEPAAARRVRCWTPSRSIPTGRCVRICAGSRRLTGCRSAGSTRCSTWSACPTVAGKKAGTLSLGMSQRLGHRGRTARRPAGAAVRRAGQRAGSRGHPLGAHADAHACGRGPHGFRVEPPARRDVQHRRPAGGDRARQVDRVDDGQRVRRPRRHRPGPQPAAGPAAAGAEPRRASRSTRMRQASRRLLRCWCAGRPARSSVSWPHATGSRCTS